VLTGLDQQRVVVVQVEGMEVLLFLMQQKGQMTKVMLPMMLVMLLMGTSTVAVSMVEVVEINTEEVVLVL
tara:strand:+ start:386 stop:595 length:210 start_codon:yes stop_codon:yes gene_type:complete